MGDQCILPGMKRYLPVEPWPWRGWKDAQGNKVDVPYKPAPFFGRTVPLPTDKNGRELVMGPYRVLQRTDGLFIVFDGRRPLGKSGTTPLQEKLAAILLMIRLYNEEFKVASAAQAASQSAGRTP